MTKPYDLARVDQMNSVLDDALERLRGMGPEASCSPIAIANEERERP
jgi:hypothetical protein